MVLQLTVAGISMGIVYGMVAMGMVLIFRSVGVMNFAQGDFLMLGGFICYTFNQILNLPIGISIAITAIIVAILGIVFQRLVYWPLRNAQARAIIVSTMGAAIALKELARLIWGSIPLSLDRIITEPVKIGEIVFQGQYLAILAVAAALMALVYILLEKTLIGNIMQATAQDQYTASLMGIPVIVSISLTFAISICIAGIAGTLLTPIFFLTTTAGATSGVKAFAAIVIGGFGSVQGAIIGGLIVGLVEAFGGAYISTTYQLVIIYIVLIIMLMFRPQGIFGGKIQEKA
ncbi:MAG: branched-chain amino acid ABC transporter permease [Christensenellales bacterium]